MRCFWYDREPNFGDRLTPWLFLRMYGINLEHAEPGKADMFCVGSILDQVPPGYNGHILGTGLISRDVYVDLRGAKVHLMRGELTKSRCRLADRNVPIGDPGILIGQFVPKYNKTIEVGIIPHYMDADNEDVQKWRLDPSAAVINVTDSVESVIGLAARCKAIVSSSLHGLILADSLGIPNKWVKLGDIKGGTFKFEDYYSAYWKFPTPATTIYKALNAVDTVSTMEVAANVRNAMDKFVSDVLRWS